jgi:cytosine deaminase
MFDTVLRNGRIAGLEHETVDIGVRDGRIAAIGPTLETGASDGAREFALDGRLVIPGFVETHIHLDKSCISDRCACRTGTLKEAIETVAAAKLAFTEDDIYARARRTLEKAIVQGTTRMRTHVEVDPRIGLKGFRAISALKRDYAWAIDVEICSFPQEGLNNDPGTFELLVEACENGADLIGGCPYTDSDPHRQIARIFDLARRFDVDIDFHLDFDLDPSWMHLDEVCRQTKEHGWGGRVAHSCILAARRRKTRRRRRRGDGAAGNRPVPDGARRHPFRAARRRAGAPAARTRRGLFARDQ